MLGSLRRNILSSPKIIIAPNANLYDPTSYRQQSKYALSTSRGKQCISVVAVLISIIVSILLFCNGDRISSLVQLKRSAIKSKNGGGGGSEYKGTLWQTDRTVQVDNVAQTPFARCDIHHVRSEDGHTTAHDWIFMEEMDAVNVAVVIGEKFVVFEQEKYAIPGTTLSPVGGFIDVGEAPWEAARREVKEELGLGSGRTLQQMKDLGYDLENSDGGGGTKDDTVYNSIPKMDRKVDSYGLAEGNVPNDESNDWIFLGRYRTAANRGGGFIYTYLLKDAVPLLPKGGTVSFIPSGDDEAQKIIFLTTSQVLQSVLEGRFQEVKWTATMANSLLHMKSI